MEYNANHQAKGCRRTMGTYATVAFQAIAHPCHQMTKASIIAGRPSAEKALDLVAVTVPLLTQHERWVFLLASQYQYHKPMKLHCYSLEPPLTFVDLAAPDASTMQTNRRLISTVETYMLILLHLNANGPCGSKRTAVDRNQFAAVKAPTS